MSSNVEVVGRNLASNDTNAASEEPVSGDSWPGKACSIAATVDVVGDRWSILILRSVFRGRHRFGELRTELGIAKNLLAQRLCRLVDDEILHKVPYQQRPVRFEYRLTAKGADLYQALMSLMQWGDRWYADGDPPTILVHETCGRDLDLSVRCPHCDVPVRPSQVASRPGANQTPGEQP